ncbi:tetratricopeptide repeat protein [Hymenobacter sp. 102]|uniref:tetratricopeptide repeat protein n=1 Tax=Hymenobacter sp. 102 TaxID=3403152 RepID=UPI003CF395C0
MSFLAVVRRGMRSGSQWLLWLLLYTLVPGRCFGEPPRDTLTPTQAKAYAEVLNMRPAAARALLNGSDAGTLLVQDCLGITELLISQDASRYAATVQAQDQRLKQLQQLPAGALPAYTAAEIRLHQAAAQVVFGHEVQGAWSLRQSYLAMQQVVRRYPQYLPARKTLGMLQFFIGSLPESYRWFLKLLGLPGSVEAGLHNLRRAAAEPNDFQLESRLILALLEETYYKKPEAALTLMGTLQRQQPRSQLLSYLLISQLKKQHRTDEALAAYRTRPTGPEYLPLPYLHHMAADLLLYQGQYAASQHENLLFLQQYPGQHYRKDAWFKLYLAAWLGGNPAAADKYRRQIGAGGRTVLEEDTYAQRFLEDRQPLNPVLTRARLQIDGGYYRPALATLDGFEPTATTPLRDRLEEPYRRARALHLLGRPDSARPYYARTIALAGTASYYFAPQSALQLGYLYQAEGQAATARAYFRKALSYPRHEYKNSTDTKAKLALKELGE